MRHFFKISMLFLFFGLQSALAKDTVYILINPQHCLSSVPSYLFLENEIKEKRKLEVVFILCKIRKSLAKKYVQGLFRTESEELNILVNDSLFFALGQTFLSGIYDSKSGKYFYGFDDFLESAYSDIDTIYVDESKHLGSPYLKLNKYGSIFLVETKEKLIAKCNHNGMISHIINFDDIWRIRELASLSANTDLHDINLLEDKDSIITLLKKDKNYSNLIDMKVGSQFIAGSSINVMTKQYEVKHAKNLSFEKNIELHRTTYFVHLDTMNLSVQKAWKLQLPDDSVDINTNSFYFTQDSTLIVPLQPYFTGVDKDYPSLAIFKLKNGNMLFQKYATNGLPPFSLSSGYLHNFFNPIFIESGQEIYYFETTTMCFYKLNSPQYEFCLPGFTENTIETIFKYFRTTGDLAESWESGNALNAITYSYDMDNLSQAHQKLFVLDLKNKKILEEVELGFVGTKQTNNPKYFNGYTYKLVISEDDKLLIIKERFNR
jgi:hypothetical protein